MIRHRFVFIVALLMAVALASASPVAWSQSDTATQELDLEFWKTIRDSKDPAEFRAYLAEFPDGKFSRIATIRLKKLEHSKSATSPSKSKPAAAPTTSTGKSSQKHQPAVTPSDTIEWCSMPDSVKRLKIADCFSRNGIPAPNNEGAERLRDKYFAGKDHKAYAKARSGSGGYAVEQYNTVEAKKLALLHCRGGAEQPATCKVVNVDGKHVDGLPKPKSDSASSSSYVNLDDLTGTYSLKSDEGKNLDGYVKLSISGGEIVGEIEMCFNFDFCSKYKKELIQKVRRSRYIQAKFKMLRGISAMPKTIHITFVFSADAETYHGTIGRIAVKGKRRR